jgi:hypothetical protein
MADLESIKESLDRLTVATQNQAIAQAKVEEKVTSSALMSEHQYNNLKMQMTTFATRIELEAVRGDIREMKDERTLLNRWVWGSWAAIIFGSLWAASKKMF